MADIPAELDSYRRAIDNLDAALVHILASDSVASRWFSRLERDLPASDPLREERPRNAPSLDSVLRILH